ncbi:MAG: hypothetical protein J0H78_17205 [Rhizobiales bacterium]|nr:hypothetical protein [Hyphomicrobiales bacterium]
MMMKRALLSLAMTTLSATAFAQDIRGLEICTAEKQMDRRTSCLQSNVQFLQQTLTRVTREAQEKLTAAGREIAAHQADIATLKADIAGLRAELAALKKAPPASGKK